MAKMTYFSEGCNDVTQLIEIMHRNRLKVFLFDSKGFHGTSKYVIIIRVVLILNFDKYVVAGMS